MKQINNNIEKTYKPKIKLSGKDVNIFTLVAIVSNALKKENQIKEAKELWDKLFDCKSYEEAIRLIGNYCDIS